MLSNAQGGERLPHRGLVVAAAAGVFVLLFLIYLATLMPTVVDQDSGELVAAAHVLGIPHPTGYPLWALLGRAFDFLPVGHTSAYRVALLSAVCAAAAGALVTLLTVGLTRRPFPAALAGLAFGLWYPTWSQAVRAEVYALTGLLFVLALLALARWEGARSPRALAWLALACGFVSMHHRTAFLAALPALAAAVALTRPRRVRVYLLAGALFLAPFVLYAYLPIRALARPPVNWTDPTTLDRFLAHALATQYTHFAFSHSPAEMLSGGRALLPEVLAAQVGMAWLLAVMGLPLIVWGWWDWRRREPLVGWSLLSGALLLSFWVLQWGETSDLKVFLLPLGAVVGICGGVGLTRLGERLPESTPRGYLAAGVGVILCAALVRVNWERSDLHNVWQHRDRIAALVDQLEPGAVFVSDSDVASFGVMYLQNVEGLRQDVILLRTPRLADEWYLRLIEDPEVREAAREAWSRAVPYSEDHTERSAAFAYHLAKLLRGRRTVYAGHGPREIALPGPPYSMGLGTFLVKVTFELPEVLKEKTPGPPLAELPGGARVVGFTWDKESAGNGEIVGFEVEWQLGSAQPKAWFALGFTPTAGEIEGLRLLLAKGRFVQGFPLVHGLPGVGPSPEGTVYEQRGAVIVPTNAPPGTYFAAIGYSEKESPNYGEWVALGKFQVESRPRPTNGP